MAPWETSVPSSGIVAQGVRESRAVSLDGRPQSDQIRVRRNQTLEGPDQVVNGS